MSNDSSKFGLLDLFKISGLIIILISVGLGLLYFFKGNIALSGFLTLMVVVGFFITINFLEKNKQFMVNSRFRHWSMYIWIVFFALSGVTYLFMEHAFNIEFGYKQRIMSQAEERVKALDLIIDDFQSHGTSVIRDYKSSYRTNLAYATNSPTDPYFIKLTGRPYNWSASALSGWLLRTSSDQTTRFSNISLLVADADSIKSRGFNLKLSSVKAKVQQIKNQNWNVFINWNRLKLEYAFVNLESEAKILVDDLNSYCLSSLPYVNTPSTQPLVHVTQNTPLKLDDMAAIRGEFGQGRATALGLFMMTQLLLLVWLIFLI